MEARLCAIRSAALAKRTAFRLPYVKYSTGADRTTHTAYRAIGKPDSTVARRAFLEGRAIGEWHAESKCLFCASALFGVQRSFLPYLFCQDRKDMARGAADAASQIAPRLRRIRTAPPEASHAIRRKKTPPFWGFFYAQSYPHVDVDCLQIFCSQLRNRCFTKLPVDRSDLRAHLPVDK